MWANNSFCVPIPDLYPLPSKIGFFKIKLILFEKIIKNEKYIDRSITLFLGCLSDINNNHSMEAYLL